MDITATMIRYDNFSREGTEFLLGFMDSSRRWRYVKDGNLHIDMYGKGNAIIPLEHMKYYVRKDDSPFFLLVAPAEQFSDDFEDDDCFEINDYKFVLCANPATCYFSKYFTGEAKQKMVTKRFSRYVLPEKIKNDDNCSFEKVGYYVGLAMAEILQEEVELGDDMSWDC